MTSNKAKEINKKEKLVGKKFQFSFFTSNKKHSTIGTGTILPTRAINEA